MGFGSDFKLRLFCSLFFLAALVCFFHSSAGGLKSVMIAAPAGQKRWGWNKTLKETIMEVMSFANNDFQCEEQLFQSLLIRLLQQKRAPIQHF